MANVISTSGLKGVAMASCHCLSCEVHFYSSETHHVVQGQKQPARPSADDVARPGATRHGARHGTRRRQRLQPEEPWKRDAERKTLVTKGHTAHLPSSECPPQGHPRGRGAERWRRAWRPRGRGDRLGSLCELTEASEFTCGGGCVCL